MQTRLVLALGLAAVLASGCGGAETESASTGAGGPTPESGRPADIGLAKMTGGPRENAILRLEVTEAGFHPAGRTAPAGQRYYTVGLRGRSRSDSGALMGASKGDDVLIDIRRFVFAQNERGCLSAAERDTAGVPNAFGDTMTFSPASDVEGRLVFLVPAESQHIRVLIAPAGQDGLAVPAGDDFTPSWPSPVETIDDGTTLQVMVLPSPEPPASLPAPAAGREFVMLDVVVKNLSQMQGIEFQPSQQLRLMDAAGKFTQAAAATTQLGCHMSDGDVIPPGQFRRLMAVYDVAVGQAYRLQYRGFEKEEAIVALRK